jgi:hypothetical protein
MLHHAKQASQLTFPEISIFIITNRQQAAGINEQSKAQTDISSICFRSIKMTAA